MFVKTLQEVLFTPIKALRVRYLPLLMIYFAFGASTFTGIAESVWVKEHLDLSAEALLMIGVWVSLPWTIKMVFGQFVDSVPLLGSPRKAYIFIAAALMTTGYLLLAGMAGEWPWVVALGDKANLYLAASLISVIGLVLQDVVADGMTVEVVKRKDDNGQPRDAQAIKEDLAMVQLLGRLSLSLGIFVVAGLGGWLAEIFSYETMFLLALVIPLISISGTLLVKLDTPERKPINKQVLGGGLIYAIFVTSLGATNWQYSQEVVFVVSMLVVIYLLYSVVHELTRPILMALFSAAVVIFVYRSMPGVGPGITWWYLDELKFNKAFLGTLSQVGAGLSILGMWFGAKIITEKPINQVLAWLTVIGFVLGLPPILMFYGLHEWTEAMFGFGAKTIALIDTAVSSPFAQLSMIPMLALIAIHAPRGNAATWFALMASLMNLALTAGTLLTKYLNKIWIVTREVKDQAGNIKVEADYSELGILMIVASLIGLVVPLLTIWLFMSKNGKEAIEMQQKEEKAISA